MDLNLREKIALIEIFQKTVYYIEIHHLVLQHAKAQGVFTLVVGLHERTLMRVARKLGVKTYSTQHGSIGLLISYYAEVDQFFVWGESSKFQLEEMGFEGEIHISGNPAFGNGFILERGAQKETRRMIVDKYGLENRKLSKVALGAEKSVASEKVQDLGLVLEKYADYTILSLEINQESEDLYQYLKSEKLDLQKIVLIVGNEVEGVSKSLLAKSHRVVHLPMNGVKESLNVAVAFAVAAYALSYFKT